MPRTIPDIPMSEIIRSKKHVVSVELNKSGFSTSFNLHKAERRVPTVSRDPRPKSQQKSQRMGSAQPRGRPGGDGDLDRPDTPSYLLIEETLIPSVNPKDLRELDVDRKTLPTMTAMAVEGSSKYYPKRVDNVGLHKPARKYFSPSPILSKPETMSSVEAFDSRKVFESPSMRSLYSASPDVEMGPGQLSPTSYTHFKSTIEIDEWEDDFYGSVVPSKADSLMTQKRPSVRIGSPQRLEKPPYFNSPFRIDVEKPRNEEKDKSKDKSRLTSTPEGTADPAEGRDAPQCPPVIDKSKLRDYSMLALACRRAGKTGQAGMSYYNMGILYDNVGAYGKAVQCYKKYLAACRLTKDVTGEALAYNCIGIDYQRMGSKFTQQAIHYHTKHRDIADVAGKFLSHLNLGIAYMSLGENEKSVLNHKHALQFAIRLSDQNGEALACANLGIAGSKTGDFAIAKAFMDRHMALTAGSSEVKGKGEVFRQLGQLANSRGEYDDAQKFFQKAMRHASTEEKKIVLSSKCSMGIAIGNAKMDEYMQTIAENMQKTQP